MPADTVAQTISIVPNQEVAQAQQIPAPALRVPAARLPVYAPKQDRH